MAGGILDTSGSEVYGTVTSLDAWDVIRYSALEPLSVVKLTVEGGGSLDLSDELATEVGAAVKHRAVILRSGDPSGYTFVTGSGDDQIRTFGDDTVYAGEGNDWLRGYDGDDILYGDAGDDQLNGELGYNTLYGGDGNDKLNSEGLRDTFYGGSGDDFLADNGGTGNLLYGGEGNDFLRADLGSNSLFGGDGNDTLQGSDGQNFLYGGDGSDSLVGGFDNDTLMGEGGNDTLTANNYANVLKGGTGDDIYVTYSSVTVVEGVGEGTDEVRSSSHYTLGANLENLVLNGLDFVGWSALNGTGNSLGNSITGNPVTNTLSGLGGSDLLVGRGGADRLLGGASNDRLDGGTGGDWLTGGAGVDTVAGSLGNDLFVFASRAEAGDVLTDFRNVSGDNDRFHISASAFGGGLVAGAALAASKFQIADDNVLSGKAEAGIRFIFEKDATKLWFDSNGSASGGLMLVADLQAGATMTAADIWLY